eukprot:146845-Chlamydomonas_euryale.AAC.6
MKYLESRLPGACDAGGHAGGARAGNVFGLDEAELAADAARKIALGGVAAQRNAAHMAGVPVPGGGGSSGGAGATGGLGYHSAGAVSIAGAPPRRGLPSRGAPPSRSAAPPGSGAGDGFSGGGSAVHLPEFGTGGAAGGSGGGKELSLRNARLTQLPPDLWAAAPFLGKLDLSGNHLASLPPAALGESRRAGEREGGGLDKGRRRAEDGLCRVWVAETWMGVFGRVCLDGCVWKGWREAQSMWAVRVA